MKGYIIKFNGTVIGKYGRPLKPDTSTGYARVRINDVWILVHRLVAIEFIPNPDNKPFVHHIDSNKLNNHVHNLEWVTSAENNRYESKLDQMQVDAIRYVCKAGHRQEDIAKYFGIGQDSVSRIINFKRWEQAEENRPVTKAMNLKGQ